MSLLEEARNESKTNDARPMTGEEYLESLRDGREVYIYGERVDDVTTHRAFGNSARSVARLLERLGVPLEEGALVQLACTVTDSHPADDHTLHIGHVDGLRHEHDDPLVFFTGAFKSLNIQGEATWAI